MQESVNTKLLGLQHITTWTRTAI